MDAITLSSQTMYGIDNTDNKFIESKKNVETQRICQVLYETSPSYNVITIAGGKYILLSASDLSTINTKMELKTYVEVENMNPGLSKKINNIYNGVIITSLILILLSIFNISYSLLNISDEYSIAIAICASIGCLAMTIDKYNFMKDIHNE